MGIKKTLATTDRGLRRTLAAQPRVFDTKQ